MTKNIIIAVLIAVILTGFGVYAYALPKPPLPVLPEVLNQSGNGQGHSTNVRIYYLNAEYEPGKHKIMKVWASVFGEALPEDNPDTAINVPYTVIEFDLKYNRFLASKILNNTVSIPGFNGLPPQIYDRYYVNNAGQIVSREGQIMSINLNPEKESWKLSQLHGLTQAELTTYVDNQFYNGMTEAQIDSYIDSQMATITNLTQAKTVIGALLKQLVAEDKAIVELTKKMAQVELYLAKQAELE